MFENLKYKKDIDYHKTALSDSFVITMTCSYISFPTFSHKADIVFLKKSKKYKSFF